MNTSDTLFGEVTAEEVKNAMDIGKNIKILDVRTIPEFKKGALQGSLNIPLDEIEHSINTVVPDKDSQIFVYCLSGSRSLIAAGILKKLGYKNVYNLVSGLLSWRSKGYPLVK